MTLPDHISLPGVPGGLIRREYASPILRRQYLERYLAGLQREMNHVAARDEQLQYEHAQTLRELIGLSPGKVGGSL